MTPRAVLRPQVPDDLEAILRYLAERSPAAADRFADAAQATLADLALMPGKGSPKRFRGLASLDVRSWHVAGFPNYLILYRPISDGIEVLAIVHGARHLPRLLRQRRRPKG